MLKENEYNEFKKTTGELNEAMVSISAILNKHGHGMIYFGLKNNDTPYSAFGKYYIRTADEDRELSPGELRKIMIGKEYEENWGNCSSNETVEDVDEQTLRKFYLSATECGRLPNIDNDRRKILEKLGVLSGEYLKLYKW